MQMTRRDALRGLLALGLVAPTSALFAPAQRAVAQLWPPVWFWDSFTPRKLPGLVLWLRGDTGLYQTSAMTTLAVADADPVGGWQDQSGQGHHVTQATAGKRPTLKLAIQNGRNVVRWDGVDDYLRGSIVQAQPLTVFVVAQVTSYAAYHVLMDGASASEVLLRAQITTGIVEAYAGTSVIATTTGPTAATWHLYTACYNGASSFVQWDATALKTGNMGANTLTSLITLGMGGDTTSSPFLGDMGEIVLMAGVASGNQVRQMQQYARRQWNTP